MAQSDPGTNKHWPTLLTAFTLDGSNWNTLPPPKKTTKRLFYILKLLDLLLLFHVFKYLFSPFWSSALPALLSMTGGCWRLKDSFNLLYFVYVFWDFWNFFWRFNMNELRFGHDCMCLRLCNSLWRRVNNFGSCLVSNGESSHALWLPAFTVCMSLMCILHEKCKWGSTSRVDSSTAV